MNYAAFKVWQSAFLDFPKDHTIQSIIFLPNSVKHLFTLLHNIYTLNCLIPRPHYRAAPHIPLVRVFHNIS